MQQVQHMRNMQAQNAANQGNPMERQGSQMDVNGARSGSPKNGEAPSPKRARLDGMMQQMNQARPGQPGQIPGNQVGSPVQFSLLPPPIQPTLSIPHSTPICARTSVAASQRLQSLPSNSPAISKSTKPSSPFAIPTTSKISSTSH